MSASSPRLLLAVALVAVVGVGLGVKYLGGGPVRPLPEAEPSVTPAEILAELRRREGFEPLGHTPSARAPNPAEPKPPEVSEGLTFGARLLGENAEPLAGAELSWLVRDGSGLPSPKRVAIADRGGAVWLALARDELPPVGPLVLAAGGPGRMRQLLSLPRERWEGVALVSLGELTLRAGGAVTGRVLDESGEPVAGAFAGLGPERGELGEEARAQARLWPLLEELGLESGPPLAFTGPDGTYRIDGLPTGRFEVVAAGLPRGDEALLPDRQEGVTILPGAETRVRDLVLRAPRASERIVGTVRAPDGAPLAGARVALGDEAGRVRFPTVSESSSLGRFVVLAPADGVYRIYATDRDGRWGGLERSDVRPGGPELELRFTEGSPLR